MSWDAKPKEQLERLADYLNNLDAVDENSNKTPVVDQMIELHNDYRQMVRFGERFRNTLADLECAGTGELCSDQTPETAVDCCNPCQVWQQAFFPPEPEPTPAPEPPKLSLVPDPG